MRIAVGVGKKFVIADSLSYFALNTTKAGQATSAGGLWVWSPVVWFLSDMRSPSKLFQVVEPPIDASGTTAAM